jgi:Metallopeptidase toxin 3
LLFVGFRSPEQQHGATIMLVKEREGTNTKGLIKYCRNLLPLVPHKAWIWRPVLKYALVESKATSQRYPNPAYPLPANEDKLRRAVQWGTKPYIDVIDLEPYKLDGSADIYALFYPKTPDYIYLDSQKIRVFEQVFPEEETLMYSECIILHEFIHWARHHFPHADQPATLWNGRAAPDHVSDGFELHAYGRDKSSIYADLLAKSRTK